MGAGRFVVRDAVAADMVDVSRLYNALIPTTTIAWTESVETLDDRHRWFADRTAAGDAVVVAVSNEGGDDRDGQVIGFASYGEFRDNTKWPGYRFTVEHTIHVDAEWQGRGLGRALVEVLVYRARAAGMHVMVAAVDGTNEGSIRFHERLGFTEVARLPETGYKFGRWLDLVLLQRIL